MKRIEIKIRRKMCASCHLRRARFMFRGRVRWDRFHSYCPQCFRSCSDHLRAVLAAAADVITQDAENTFGVRPDPMLLGSGPGAFVVSNPLPPYAGAAELAAAAETAQAAA